MASQLLPPEILVPIFALAGPNASALVAVCRSWRPIAEETLYSSIHLVNSKSSQIQSGIFLDVTCSRSETSNRLRLLCTSLRFQNHRLATLVRRLHFSFYSPDVAEALCVAEIIAACKLTTDICLHSYTGFSRSESVVSSSLKDAISQLANLRSLEFAGVHPGFTSPDITHILRRCPRLSGLTLTLGPEEAPTGLTPEKREVRTVEGFKHLRELHLLKEWYTPVAADLCRLADLALPNLQSFSTSVGEDCETHEALAKCLKTWAPTLSRLALTTRHLKPGSGVLDAVLPNLTALIDLESNSKIFSLAAVLEATAIQRLVLCHWIDPEIERLCRVLLEGRDQCKTPALPRLRVLEMCKCDKGIRDGLERVRDARKIDIVPNAASMNPHA